VISPHGAVRQHFTAFVEQSEPPSFVARALRRVLDFGVLAKGFLRVRCDACKRERLVAFPYRDCGCLPPQKGAKFQCPNCSSRRAAETAMHIVDSVLPHLLIGPLTPAVQPEH
jgi:hypothetical protein